VARGRVPSTATPVTCRLGLTSPVSPTTRRGGGDPLPALRHCARQGVGSCTQESVQESGRTGISSNRMASPASTTTGVRAKMTTTTSTSHRKTLAAAWTCRRYPAEITAADYGEGRAGWGRPDEPANRTLAHRTPGPRPTHARAPRKPRHRRAIGARDSGRPSTVQEERGVLPPSAESRLRRLLPDRDVASTLGCERFAMPSAPPLPQRHPRELRHEVELGWPGDSSMPWTRTPPRLSGSAIRPVPMPNSRAAPDPARSAKKSRLGCTNAGSNSSGHNVS
jgi:hypothetical protein